MIAVLAAAGTLSLTCTVAEVVPLIDRETDVTRTVNLVAGGPGVTVSGWDDLLGGGTFALRNDGAGFEIERDVDGVGFPTRGLARLRPDAAAGAYTIDWGLAEQRSVDGEWFYTSLARGRCVPGAAR